MLNNNMENSPRNVESSEQKVSPSHTTDRTKKLICDDPIPGSAEEYERATAIAARKEEESAGGGRAPAASQQTEQQQQGLIHPGPGWPGAHSLAIVLGSPAAHRDSNNIFRDFTIKINQQQQYRC